MESTRECLTNGVLNITRTINPKLYSISQTEGYEIDRRYFDILHAKWFRLFSRSLLKNCFSLFSEIFHKYDRFIYPKPRNSCLWGDIRAFFQEFFPKWKGFRVDKFDRKIQPVEALQTLTALVESASVVCTFTSGYFGRKCLDENKLNLRKVGTTSD